MQTFEKRLKYNKYNNMDNIITIDLHNNYTIIALISKKENKDYCVALRLKENTIDKWDVIENAQNIIFDSNINIYSAILRTIDTYVYEGFFNRYIDRYEYELKCFEIGNEIEESKRLDGADVS